MITRQDGVRGLAMLLGLLGVFGLLGVVSACGETPDDVATSTSTTTSTASSTTTEPPTTATLVTTTELAPRTTTRAGDKTVGSPAPAVRVVTGAEKLVESDFKAIAGMRVGLISHQNSVVDGVHLADHLAAAPTVELVALFGPEHGARGDRDAGEHVDDAIDPSTGVPVFSLFGETRQPTPEMLEGIDVLLFDLQDVGARFYTYASTMGLAMQAAAAADVSFIVLDRPNPLGGLMGGGVLDESATSFVGLYPVSDTHGSTMGELARAAKANGWLAGTTTLDLSVIEMTGWDGSLRWPDTGLEWIAPSPALTSFDAALVYPATVYLEATSLSYGRGTDRPFTVFGAPWLDADRVAATLHDLSLPGLAFNATTITPRMLDAMSVEPAFLDTQIPAVEIDVVDHTVVRPSEAAVHVLEVVLADGSASGVDALERPEWLDQLSGSSRLREDLANDVNAAEIIRRQRAEVATLEPKLVDHHLYARPSQ